ncbi:MAG: RluA family pseudouridine synthase [Oscillospiraceae bacterium]|jgi:23S rRNA pseudouridine955/2504/2580 synthase|nr:RluA family pseudouridine synthase [Oscillospiraceae bacterium]
MKQFTIQKNDAGARLDRFVSKAAPLLPPSLAQKYIRLKRIKVNGKGSTRDARLVFGDTVEMYVNDEFFDAPREENAFLRIGDPSLDIVFEDENLLLLNKPAGVLCHSDGGFDYSTLIARVQAYMYQKREWNPKEENAFAPALCNRIDRNTQGIVIAAKNAEALRIVNEKIKLREIDKYYLAVALGRPPRARGRLEGFLFKDAKRNQVFLSENQVVGSQFAATEYRVLKSKGELSLLECRLLTGRTHQIRAQLARAGCAILGDGKYGSERENRKYGESSQLLCSYRLKFAFATDAGALAYLNGREFRLKEVDFVTKYFGCTTDSIVV